MLSYQTLDKIADSVNPILAVITLLIPWATPAGRRWGTIHFLAGASMGIVLAYLLQYIDQHLGVWKFAGLDYSTHTAFATVLLLSIGMLGSRFALVAATVGVAYTALMVYQRYHSLA